MKTTTLIFLLALVAGCGSSNPVVGKWKPVAVETGGEIITFAEKVKLGNIKNGMRLAHSIPFEITANGDYLSGENRNPIKIEKDRYTVTYKAHGQEKEAVMIYKVEKNTLKIMRPGGDYWLILERMEKDK